MKKYEVIHWFNEGWDEEVLEEFKSFEEAENFCKEEYNSSYCEHEEGLSIRCYEDDEVFDEPWE